MDADQISARLKLRQLRAVVVLAQSRSMAKAAEILCVTQPVISKSIAELEDVLGVRLFDRSPSGVEPTIYGHALVDRALSVFHELKAGVNQLRSLADGTAGELRVGSSEAVAAGMLGSVIDLMSARFPSVSFELVLGGDLSELPYHDLRTHNIDLIIGRLPDVVPEDVEGSFLYKEESCIAAGAHHELVGRTSVDLSELLNEPWCGPPFEKFPWSLTADAFRAAGLGVPEPIVRVRSMSARNNLLTAGQFLTVYPKSLLYFAGEKLSIREVPVEIRNANYSVGVVSLKHRLLHPAAKSFVDFAFQVSRQFTDRGVVV